MLKKKLNFFVLSTILFCSLSLQAKEFDGFASPESIYGNKHGIFVSNVGKELLPLEKDNDGFISKLDSNGNVIEKKFISNLNAPKGMNSIDDILYVADIDTIKGFDLNNKKEVFNLPIKNAVFLNAIEILDNNTLLVSDTGTGIIHVIDIDNNKYDTFVKLDSKFAGPNGLLLDKDNNRLIAVGYDPNGKAKGSIVSIDLKSKKQVALSEPLGALDGVVFAKNGDLLVSDWGENLKGVVYQMDKKGNIKVLDLPAMKGPKTPTSSTATTKRCWSRPGCRTATWRWCASASRWTSPSS